MKQQVKLENDELLNEKQAAAILGVRPTTLQVWRHSKRYPLAYAKIGGLVKYPRSAIQAFIESRIVRA